MTNEGMEAESFEEEDSGAGAYIAYVGRSSFRMEQVPAPVNDNHAENEADIVDQSERSIETLRMRAGAAPSPDEPELAIPTAGGRAVSTVSSILVARLELPRWILAAMTLLVFASGVLVAASVVGGTKNLLTLHPAAVVAEAPAPAPPPATSMVVTPIPEAVTPAKRAGTPRAQTTTAPATIPVKQTSNPLSRPAARRPRSSAPPAQRSAPTPSALASPATWVDPFAE